MRHKNRAKYIENYHLCKEQAEKQSKKRWKTNKRKEILMKDGQKYKAAISQCTGNRKTTALLIISKRVQKFTSFTTLASVYAKGKMFSAY